MCFATVINITRVSNTILALYLSSDTWITCKILWKDGKSAGWSTVAPYLASDDLWNEYRNT